MSVFFDKIKKLMRKDNGNDTPTSFHDSTEVVPETTEEVPDNGSHYRMKGFTLVSPGRTAVVHRLIGHHLRVGRDHPKLVMESTNGPWVTRFMGYGQSDRTIRVRTDGWTPVHERAISRVRAVQR